MLQLEEKHTALHAMCIKPGIKFENQRDNEEVLLSLRAHPITLIPIFFNSFIIIILIFFSIFILNQFLNPVQLIYTIIFFLLATFIYNWYHIIKWYFNIGIVTNLQIVDVDFSAFSFRNITRTELTHVEDISVKVSGFIPSIFNFGNIFIQTAGSEVNTEFLQIPHPAEAGHIIQEILKQYGSTE